MSAALFYEIHERIASDFLDAHPGLPPALAWERTRTQAFEVTIDLLAERQRRVIDERATPEDK